MKKKREWQLEEVKQESEQQKQITRNKAITDYINEQMRLALQQYVVAPNEQLTLRMTIRLD